MTQILPLFGNGPAGPPGSAWHDGAGAPPNGLGLDGDFYLDHNTGDVYRKSGGTYILTGNIRGPQGLIGSQGIIGLTGPSGPVGARGTVWRNGPSNPLDSVGVDGDYYLNDTTGDVLERINGTYVLVANIKGAPGVADHALLLHLDFASSGHTGFAPSDSPTFTGTPAAPTAAAATNTTQLATTAFVRTEVANLINAAPTTLDTLGEIAAQLASDESAAAALTTAVGSKAGLGANTFTGTQTISFTDASGTGVVRNALVVTPTYNQTSTAGAVDFLLNRTETVLGSGAQYLMRLQKNGVDQFIVSNVGDVNVASALAATTVNTTNVRPATTNQTLNIANRAFTLATVAADVANIGITNSSGQFVGLAVRPTYNQSGSGGATDLLVNRIETVIGSGGHFLVDFQVSGNSKFRIQNNGITYFNNTAGLQTAFWFQDGGVSKWQLGKQTDNTFFLYDNVNSRNTLATDTSGNLTVLPSGGRLLLGQGTFASASGTDNPVRISPTYNQSGTAAATDLLVNRTQPAVGSGAQLLADFQTNSASKFSISNVGDVNLSGNIIVGNPGIGVSSKVTFTKTSDYAWLAVREVVSDTTIYEFGMGDNPDGAADAFRWIINDYQQPGGAWEPMRLSNVQSEFHGYRHTFYGNLRVFETPFYTGAEAGVAIGGNSSGLPNSGKVNTVWTTQVAPALTLTPNVVGFIGTTTAVYWVKIDGTGTPNTFSWGTGPTSGILGSAVPITGAAQALNNGVTITFNATTGGVLNDMYSWRVYAGGKLELGPDVNLYRLSADNLKTDDSLTVVGTMTTLGRTTTLGSINAAGLLAFNRGSDGNPGGSVGFAASSTEATEFRYTISSGAGFHTFFNNISGAVAERLRIAGGGTSSSAVDLGLSLTPTYNQTLTAGGTDLLINRTETVIGSGAHNFVDFQVAGVSKFAIDRLGIVKVNADLMSLPVGGSLRIQNKSFTGAAVALQVLGSNTITNTTGQFTGLAILPTYNQAAANGSNTELLINRTETSIGSGQQRFIDCQIAGVTKFAISNQGSVAALNVTALANDTTLTVQPRSFTVAGVGVAMMTGTMTNTSGQFTGVSITPTYNQAAASGSNTDLIINRTETAVGSGAQRFLDCQTAGVSKFRVSNDGSIATPRAASTANDLTLTLQDRNFTAAGTVISGNIGTHSNSAGTVFGLALTPTYNQTLTGAATDLFINRTETVIGSGTHRLADFQVGSVTKFAIDRSGTVIAPEIKSLGNDQNFLLQSRSFTVAGAALTVASGTFSASSGTQTGVAITPTYNQTLTAGGTDLLIGRTQTAAGSGSQLFLDCQLNGVSMARIESGGGVVTGGVRNPGGTLQLSNTQAGASVPYLTQQSGILSGASIAQAAFYLSPTWNQTGTSSATDFLINRSETALGSGAQNLADFQVAGVSKFRFDNAGTFFVNLLQSNVAGTISMQSRTFSGASGTDNPVKIVPTYNQTLTAGSTDLLINRTETVLGSGSARFIDLQAGGVSKWYVRNDGVEFTDNIQSNAAGILSLQSRTFSGSSGTDNPVRITPTYNQTSTAGAVDLLINRAETVIGSGSHRLFDCQISGISKFSVDRSGTIFFSDARSTANDVTFLLNGRDFTGANAGVNASWGNYTGASVNQTAFKITPTYNQTGTSAGTDFLINRTQTAVGSGLQSFIDCQVSGVSAFRVGTGGSILTSGSIGRSSPGTLAFAAHGITTAANVVDASTGTISNSSGTAAAFAIRPTYNQTLTGAGTDLLINRTETVVGSGAQNLADFQVAGVSKCLITNTGTVQCTRVNGNGGNGLLLLNDRGFPTATNGVQLYTANAITNSSGTFNGLAITPTYNQTLTGAATDLLVNRTETVIGSGAHRLLDLQIGGISKLYVDRLGRLVMGGAYQVSSGTIVYAAAVTPNSDAYNVLNIGTLTAAITINAPTGTPVDGQDLCIIVTQDATGGRVITWNAAYLFGTTYPSTGVVTTASKSSNVYFQYHSGTAKWRCVGIAVF